MTDQKNPYEEENKIMAALKKIREEKERRKWEKEKARQEKNYKKQWTV